MPSDRTVRLAEVSPRRRSSSKSRHRRRSNYRIAIVAYLVAWVSAGIALGWPTTEECLKAPHSGPLPLSSALQQEAAGAGLLDAAQACLPVAALNLFLWTMTGTAIGMVVYYVLRRQQH